MYYSIIKPNYNKYHLLFRSFFINIHCLIRTFIPRIGRKGLANFLPKCQPFSLYDAARCLAPCLHGS